MLQGAINCNVAMPVYIKILLQIDNIALKLIKTYILLHHIRLLLWPSMCRQVKQVCWRTGRSNIYRNCTNCLSVIILWTFKIHNSTDHDGSKPALMLVYLGVRSSLILPYCYPIRSVGSITTLSMKCICLNRSLWFFNACSVLSSSSPQYRQIITNPKLRNCCRKMKMRIAWLRCAVCIGYCMLSASFYCNIMQFY